jgi:hypothetical protein
MMSVGKGKVSNGWMTYENQLGGSVRGLIGGIVIEFA